LEGGALPLDIQLNAADDLLGAVAQQVAGRPDQDRLKVSLDDPATLSFGLFDFVHSLRILGNLVDNAFKYASGTSPIEVTSGVEGDALVFRVSDRGNGIPVAEREGVFTPFYRSPAKTSGSRSSGLGLSIARRLAEAQAGTLTYSDRDGGGAIFELRLPSAQP
jgi:two-component system sensor histidine kinase KdpD